MGAIEGVAGERQLTHGTLAVRIGPERETCLVRLIGELDLASAPFFEHELHRLLSSGLSAVILDLHELEFIDSVGLRCLIRAAEHSKRDGDRLRILAPGGDVERLIDLSGIADLLPIVR